MHSAAYYPENIVQYGVLVSIKCLDLQKDVSTMARTIRTDVAPASDEQTDKNILESNEGSANIRPGTALTIASRMVKNADEEEYLALRNFSRGREVSISAVLRDLEYAALDGARGHTPQYSRLLEDYLLQFI